MPLPWFPAHLFRPIFSVEAGSCVLALFRKVLNPFRTAQVLIAAAFPDYFLSQTATLSFIPMRQSFFFRLGCVVSSINCMEFLKTI